MTEQESIDHQAKMRAVRDEFNELWKERVVQVNKAFGAKMLQAEFLAWEFFKLGKGIKP